MALISLMRRNPVQNPKYPACFTAYDGDEVCRACPARKVCQKESPFILSKLMDRTLYQRALRFDDGVETQKAMKGRLAEPGELYKRLLAKHYNKKYMSPEAYLKAAAVVARLGMFTLQENIDLPTYIEANMVLMKKFIQAKMRRFGFQPNMLLGEKAVLRYRTYVSYAKGKSNAMSDKTANARTKYEVMRDEFYRTECAIGLEIWSAKRTGSKVSPIKAAKIVKAPAEYRTASMLDEDTPVARILTAVRWRAMRDFVDQRIPDGSRWLVVPEQLGWADLVDLIYSRTVGV